MSDSESQDGPVFHLEPQGRLANLMIEYMVALKFASLVPGCRISNIRIPEWGIDHPAIASPGPMVEQRAEQYFDMERLTTDMVEGRVRRVEWYGFGQRMEHFLPREHYAQVFAPRLVGSMGFGREYLLCPVRSGDVLHGPALAYPLTPVEFYRDIINMTGLKPVFMGETDPNPYTDRLRAAFPTATFLPPRGAMVDFETIRQSKNIVVGVSTFIWLAAWLSEADNIYLAVSGLFNPMQKRDVDLLPLGDRRYHFVLFPINYAVPLERHAQVHSNIAPHWRLVSHDALQQQLAEVPRFARSLESMLKVFDEAHYLEVNGDIKWVVSVGAFKSGLEHYIRHGFEERRYPFPLDRVWYASQYPMAAFEVAQGDYTDFCHHYLSIGKARGYKPLPG